MNDSCASTDVARRPSLEDLLAQPATAFVLFASMALAATWPLVRRFTETLPFGSADLWQNYWNLWWWKKAIFELGASPYSTDLLFYPGGADLVFHTHSSFNMIASLPVNLLFGPAAAYNFCFLLALTLSGFATWLLVRELTGDARAAVLAGIVYAFFPQRMEQSFEHLNLFSTQFIPWSLFYLVKLLREGGRRNAVGLGVCFGFNALCSWHLGLMLAMTLPFRRRSWRRGKRPGGGDWAGWRSPAWWPR